jgi:hypothetical protein
MDISEVYTASIIDLMMEAVFTSETLIDFNNTTWRYIQEGCHLQITHSFYFQLALQPFAHSL